jgi:hypothetical protein
MESKKRPAEAAEEPADAKVRAVEAPTHGVSSDRIPEVKEASHHREPTTLPRAPELSGLLETVTRRFGRPYSITPDIYIRFDTTAYRYYFSSLRTSLILAIYPDADYEENNIISEDVWIRVCRYLMKSRIDAVYSKVSGRREEGRIAIASDHKVPKALADIINGIGVVTIPSLGYNVIPQPEAHPSDKSQALSATVGHNALNQFTYLVLAAERRGLCRTGYISSVPAGRMYWLLSAKDARNVDNNANIETRSIRVQSSFSEWTPADAFLASMAVSSFDGLINTVPLGFEIDTFRDVPALRSQFNLEA